MGRPQLDQMELVGLYASHVAAAIERERLLTEATRRNRVLETLRGVLDMLAGPQPIESGLALALLALCRGLGGDAITLHGADGKVIAAGPLAPRGGGGGSVSFASSKRRPRSCSSRPAGSIGPDRSGPT